MMRRWTWVAMAVGAVLIAGCSGDTGGAGASGGKPVVAATIWPVASLVRQIVGPEVEVRCLVPPSVSPHGFEPTAADAAALHDCKALVSVGMHLDDWAPQALRRFGPQHAPILSLGVLLDLQADTPAPLPQVKAPAAGDPGADDDNGPNPHLWVDPELMARVVPKLAERLAALLPDHAAAIHTNAAKLADDLTQLDAEFRTTLKPFAGYSIVQFHDAFDRLAERYHLVIAATLSPGDSPGAMTPQHMEKAIAAIRSQHLHAVFAEPQFPPDAANAIRDETHVQVLTLDPIGDPNDPKRDTYQHLMQYNLSMLVKGLTAK